MISLGFKEYVDKLNQSYIITSFLYPDHPNFDFAKFYSLLNERDCVIYPGKLSKQNCFRIGNIGRIYKEDIKNLLENIKIVLEEMNVSLSIRFPKNNSNTLLGGISSFILNL